MRKIDGLYHIGLDQIEGSIHWYYTIDQNEDFFDVESMVEHGDTLYGNELSFFVYPECKVFTPFKKEEGVYYQSYSIVYHDGFVYFLKGDFNVKKIYLYKCNPECEMIECLYELDMEGVSLYNLAIRFEPCMIILEDEERLEIYVPNRISIKEDKNSSFCFCKDGLYYFNVWHEEGYDDSLNLVSEYKYYESYVVKDAFGNVIETGDGYLQQMEDGSYILV